MKYGLVVFVALLLVGAAFLIPYEWEVLVPAPEVGRDSAHIIFGGDMMFDRYIRQVVHTVGGDYVFSCIDAVLLPADLVVANLEGPITNAEPVSFSPESPDYNHYKFTFPLATAPLLKRHNVGVVNLGNNHMLDFSRDGLVETVAALDYAGVRHFGNPDLAEDDKVLRIELKGIPLSFINWSDWNSDKTDHIVAQVRKEKESGRIPIIFAHWGDEYAPTPERTKVLARQFVDAGAALVVGSHSHIEGEHEIYKGVHIYYSLGNFIFDQYFDESVRNGILLDVEVSHDGVFAVTKIPIVLNTDGRTCPR